MIYEVCLISYFATHFTLIFACDCFNDTNLGENAPVRCICTESNKIPDTGNIHTLVLKGFDLETVGYKQFLQFKDTLTDLYLSEFYNLKQIKKNTFNELPHLRSLYLSKAPLLLDISLDILENNSNEIRVLRVIHTGIRGLPKLRLPKHIMDIVDFEGNAIQHIETNCVWVNTAQLIFDYNEITKINGWAFNNSQISKMSLKGNKKLEILAEEAFHGLRSLTSLDLSDTAITYIPTYGLKELEVLIIRQTHSLKTIPSIYDFDNLKEAELTFSFHCCAFHLPRRHNPQKYALHKAYVQKMKDLCPESSKYPVPAANLHEDAEDLPDEEWHDIANSSRKKRSISQTLLPLQNKTLIAFCGSLRYREERVHCLPEPNAFNPCEDIMGYKWLRFCVWIVVLTGLLGNICVLAVILCKPAEMTVQNFLICNLAFSDLCMACFLSLLAVEDLISEGMYFNYAYDWQQGKGCKVAGFITIFSCQLSIFLLSLVTVERWFTIKRALYMNKLTFRRTASIVFIGWIYALIMAAAPLFGISNYSTTSLCLPMETENFWDIFYILLLLFIAFAAFITICMCYYQIYFSLSYETRHKDGEYVLARKMTILVAMNFVCWAPITFFALTAVLGFPLINITDSKILLVFFYPLNSCANPFLYAILTTNFKRDLMCLISKFGICKKRVKRYKMTYYQPKKNTKNPIHRPFTSQTSL